MTVWTLCIAAYLASTVLAVTLTWREQRRSGRSSPLYNAIGYLACTVWPLVALVFVISREPQT